MSRAVAIACGAALLLFVAGRCLVPMDETDLFFNLRLGEIVLSVDMMKALGAAVATLGAEELPSLEIAKRPAIPIYGMVLETRLDFT